MTDQRCLNSVIARRTDREAIELLSINQLRCLINHVIVRKSDEITMNGIINFMYVAFLVSSKSVDHDKIIYLEIQF
jgi:hypothetical protein